MSHHLLPPRVCLGRKLELEVELGLKLRCCDTGCSYLKQLVHKMPTPRLTPVIVTRQCNIIMNVGSVTCIQFSAVQFYKLCSNQEDGHIPFHLTVST